jgi:hypothetical protein
MKRFGRVNLLYGFSFEFFGDKLGFRGLCKYFSICKNVSDINICMLLSVALNIRVEVFTCVHLFGNFNIK